MGVAEEFRRLKGLHYLDHAGATLYSEQQMLSVTHDLCESVHANPHSLSVVSKLTNDIVDQMRYRILNHFNTNSEEYDIIFTSGATAALKLKGLFVYSQENHTSVLGMREIVAEKCSSIMCFSSEELAKTFSDDKITVPASPNNDGGNSLIAIPAQCNFSGAKTPLNWVEKCHAGIIGNTLQAHSKWACLLDAASLVSTSPLDLSQYKPDFVTISFYKIFGYPTGLGALIVKNSSGYMLSEKKYFGGGTVLMALSTQRQHKMRTVLHERFEDGSLSFLSIVALGHGFDTLTRLEMPMEKIKEHTFSLARRAYHSLKNLCHYNNKPVAVLYCDNDFDDPETQGPIVNFNLLESDGSHVGYHKVLIMANSHKIQLRTGCFCNPGACQRHLNQTENDLLSHFQAGHVCGDQRDIIAGKPTGSVRISIGYMTTDDDINAFLNMIYQCFVDHGPLLKQIDEAREEWHDAVEETQHKFQTFSSMTSLSQGKLLQVALYPIKSCGGFKPVNAWPIGPRGLMYDRTWMVVSAAGTALTQSLEPRLALVHPFIDLANRKLQISFSGAASSVSVPLDETDVNNQVTGSLCQSKVCGDKVKGIDCGDEVALWLSTTLGRHGIRLVRQLDEDARSKKDAKKALALSNKAQFLMVSETSVSWLGDQIHPDDCDKAGLVDRFRANLVLEGIERPFLEWDWEEIRIGTQRFTVDGPCTRCGVVCVDQATGQRTNEPLRTLSKISKSNVHFGVYLTHHPDGDDDGIGLIANNNMVTVIKSKCLTDSD